VPLAAASEPAPPPPASPSFAGLTTLRILHEKSVINDAEYEAAVREIGASVGDELSGETPTFVLGRFSTSLYGFVKGDFIYDTTQSFGDLVGNAQVERPAGAPLSPPYPPVNYKGEHDRGTFSVRESRFGFVMRAPETRGVRAVGQIEADFLGPLPPIGPGVPLPQETRPPYDTTEATTFSTPVLRLRHANVHVYTPWVDVLVGQSWQLFGWQGIYQPCMVQAQGGPGQLYARAPQLRLSKTIGTRWGIVEVAAAAARPVSRNSVYPDAQGGVRVALPGWTGIQTFGATATHVMPLSLAVTGDIRQFRVPEFDPLPQQEVALTTQSIALDAFVPVLPAKERKGNALSLRGEFVLGNGIADMYTNMTGGVQMPTVANTTGLNPPPQYPQDIDNGLVVFDLDGNLHPVKWTTYLIGAEYTLPGLEGKVWLSANYSRQVSPNAPDYTRPYAATLPDPQQAYYVSAAQVRKSLDFFDVNVFADIVPALRVGAEYARYYDRYADGVRATNHRAQLAGMFLF
jgi:hypothetical protein